MWVSQVDFTGEFDHRDALLFEGVRDERAVVEALLPVRELTHHIDVVFISSGVHFLDPHAAISHGGYAEGDPCAKGVICDQ